MPAIAPSSTSSGQMLAAARDAITVSAVPPVFSFVRPCNTTAAKSVPAGDAWLHERKLDGFRLQVIKEDRQVRLYSRPTNGRAACPAWSTSSLASPAGRPSSMRSSACPVCKRILVVEDQEDLRGALRDLLTGSGYGHRSRRWRGRRR
jgi:hypothetical protein